MRILNSATPSWLPHVDVSTPAVVLAVRDHNGLGQVRSLGRLGVAVYVTHDEVREPAAYSRYIARRFEWDIDERGPAATADFLLDVVAPAIGRRAVLLPSDDLGAIVIAEHWRRLSEAFLLPEQDPRLIRSLVDKRGLHELCRRTGIPSPETMVPSDHEDVASFSRTATYPVVIKARDGWRLRELGDAKTIVVGDQAELLATYRRLAVGDDLNIVLQEYIPGGADSVWILHGYADAAAHPVFAQVGNKLREYPMDVGMTSMAVNRPNAVVHDAGTSFARAVGYRGLFDLDFRFDRRDGEYKPIDFNPRPGANFRLFVDENEIDVVRAAYLDLTGQHVPVGPQRVGRRWMLENWDFIAARGYIAAGRLTPRAWLRSLRGVQEVAWAARDDPMPFLRMAREFVGLGLGWVGRRSRVGSVRRSHGG